MQVYCRVRPPSPRMPPKNYADLQESHDPTRPGQGGHVPTRVYATVNWGASFQFKRLKVKITGPEKPQEIAASSIRVYLWAGASGSDDDCKRPNLLSVPETLGNVMGGSISCRHLFLLKYVYIMLPIRCAELWDISCRLITQICMRWCLQFETVIPALALVIHIMIITMGFVECHAVLK